MVGPERNRPWLRRIAIAALVIGSALFSFLNAGERVTVDFAVATLYRISLVGLVFVAFLLGMLTMFLFGLRQDRRVRDALRRREEPSSISDHYPFPPPLDPPV